MYFYIWCWKLVNLTFSGKYRKYQILNVITVSSFNWEKCKNHRFEVFVFEIKCGMKTGCFETCTCTNVIELLIISIITPSYKLIWLIHTAKSWADAKLQPSNVRGGEEFTAALNWKFVDRDWILAAALGPESIIT